MSSKTFKYSLPDNVQPKFLSDNIQQNLLSLSPDLEHGVAVVDRASLGRRLTVELSEEVESQDSVEVDDHEHEESGHG